MRMVTRLSLIASLFAWSAGPANAFMCPAYPVNYLSLNGGGMVGVWVGGVGILQICNVSSQWGDITPQSCQAWYSALLTWRTISKSAYLYFDPDNPMNSGITACSGIAQWDARPPYHLEAAP